MEQQRKETISIDYDLTIVGHDNKPLQGALDVVSALAKQYKIILYTARNAKATAEAVEWYRKNNIFLSGINTNPEQEAWTNSYKCSSDLYIDDKAVGAPLDANRCLDWKKTEEWLIKNKWLSKSVLNTLEDKLKNKL
jgi:ABC-type sugar transport system substrate-binding protein